MLAKSNSKFELQVVFCEPIPAYHLEALKVLAKKAALRKLKRMMLKAQKKLYNNWGLEADPPDRDRLTYLTGS